MGNMGQFWDVFVMVAVQCASAAMNVLYKLVVEDGMNLRVLIAYRLIFATVFLVPLALIFERKSRPKLTRMILFQALLCGLFGGLLPLNLYVESLALTSLTFACAMSNLAPIITFVLSISFGLETLGLGTRAGKAKVMGTCLSMSGAMLLTFYKGPNLNVGPTHVNLLHLVNVHHHQTQMAPHHSPNLLLGALCSLGTSLSYAIWLILQRKMSKRYPCHYSSTALMCVMGTSQAVGVGLCMETDWSQWKLNNAIRLCTAAFAGIVVYALGGVAMVWCVHRRGPLFVSNFSPLSALFAAIAACLLLDEKLHLGSLLGAVLIILGLYALLWGKSKEIDNAPFPPKTSTGLDLLVISTSNSTVSDNDHSNLDGNVLHIDEQQENGVVDQIHK